MSKSFKSSMKRLVGFEPGKLSIGRAIRELTAGYEMLWLVTCSQLTPTEP